MKKLLLLATALVSVMSMAGIAAPSDGSTNTGMDTNQLDNFYVAGNLGTSQYRDASADNLPRYRDDLSHSNGVFQNVRAGWRWDGIIGPEIGYVYFGEGKKAYSQPDRVYSVQPRALTLGVNGKYNFYENWFVTARAGGMRSRTTIGCTGSFIGCDPSTNYQLPAGPYTSNTTKRNGWYGGVGVGYDVTHNVSLGLNYDDYKLRYDAVAEPDSTFETRAKRSIAAFSGSLEYRF